MLVLAHAVDVPAGRVTVTKDENGPPFDWDLVVGDPLDIRSQPESPANAVIAVEYRGSWFYIDSSDTAPITRLRYHFFCP